MAYCVAFHVSMDFSAHQTMCSLSSRPVHNCLLEALLDSLPVDNIPNSFEVLDFAVLILQARLRN